MDDYTLRIPGLKEFENALAWLRPSLILSFMLLLKIMLTLQINDDSMQPDNDRSYLERFF